MVAGTEAQVSAAVKKGPKQQTELVTPNNGPTPFVFAIIENTAVEVFMDTGSEISLISESLRMSIPSLMRKPMQKSYILAKSVTGEYLDTLGMLTISIRLGQEVFNHSVHVVRNSSQAAILGWDFLCKHHAIVNLQDNSLCLWDWSVPLLCASQKAPLKCSAIMLASLTVPAMSEMNVLAKIQPSIGEPELLCNYTGVLEPDTFTLPGLFVARSVTPVTKGVAWIRVMNPTQDDCYVSGSTRLGDFHSLVQQKGEEFSLIDASVAQVQSQAELHSAQLPVELNHTVLNKEQIQQLESLLSQYSDVFSSHERDFGRTNWVRHSIRTGEAPPIRQRAYRTSVHLRSEIDRQVQKLLSQDIIEESCSPWASPVVLVKKKDGTYRFCIDFRKLNSVTVKDSYPLPRPADALDSLSGACWFSSIDLVSGYWQVELDEHDREKTAFNTGSALYQFKVMPMGLTNAPPTFQRLMELVLRGLHWKVCLIYLDDVLVFSRTFSEHLSSLEEVFKRFRSAGLKLNPRKCHLACKEVSFLGHVVSSEGLQPDAKNLDKVRSWPTPRTTTEVRAFVGLCSYYRRFVKNFSVLAAPLHALTQKGAVFHWSTQCDDAFQSLKHALTSPPIVAHPVFTQPFLLYTDASQDCIGAVLAQSQDRKERVIAYASHTLTTAERKWSTYDRELWALVWSVRHFKHFLSGTSFTIITDHKPLLSLRKATVDNDPTGRRARWLLELDVYDFSVIHREGKQHANADAMSRRPRSPEMVTKAVQCVIGSGACTIPSTKEQQSDPTPSLPDTQSTLAIDMRELQAQQQADVCLRTTLSWLQKGGHKPPLGQLRQSPPVLRKLWHEFPKLVVHHGILCRVVRPSPHSPPLYQVVLPEVLIPIALKWVHGDQFCGHLGVERTLLRARQICYWPYMSRDIHKFCTECLPCQTRSSSTPHERAPLQSIHAERPFQKIAADITELPVTTQGYRYILAVVDFFTRFANLYPMKDQRAPTVAQCLFEHYIRQHGVPESIHTDQGRQFESDIVKHLCASLGIEKTRTSPYHAQSDGMVERLNRTLKDQLAKYIYQSGGEWDRYLPQVELAYNSSVHSSTGYSPFFLAHGREPHLPVHVSLNWNPALSASAPSSPGAYAQDLCMRLSHVFSDAIDRSIAAKLRQKGQYDKRVSFHPHQEGDLVLLDDPAQRQNKLAPRWKGPYQILKRFDKEDSPGVTYEITDPKSPQSRRWVVHHNRLKSFSGLPRDPVTRPPCPQPSEPHSDHSGVDFSPPTLTALSGSLPFQPPVPPYLSGLTNAQGDVRESEMQPSPPGSMHSTPYSTPPSSPSKTTPRQALQQVESLALNAPLKITRSGRMVKPPDRFGSFVT